MDETAHEELAPGPGAYHPATAVVDAGRAVDVCKINIVYSYEVADQEFHGRHKMNLASADMAEQAAFSLQAARISVHFNPKRPGQSVVRDDEVYQKLQ